MRWDFLGEVEVGWKARKVRARIAGTSAVTFLTYSPTIEHVRALSSYEKIFPNIPHTRSVHSRVGADIAGAAMSTLQNSSTIL